MKLEFLELELHGKLMFQKSVKSLIISQIVVDHQISPPKMVFDHFSLSFFLR